MAGQIVLVKFQIALVLIPKNGLEESTSWVVPTDRSFVPLALLSFFTVLYVWMQRILQMVATVSNIFLIQNKCEYDLNHDINEEICFVFLVNFEGHVDPQDQYCQQNDRYSTSLKIDFTVIFNVSAVTVHKFYSEIS